MICPHCNTHIPDGSAICPACHATLESTVVMRRITGTFCRSCGALIPDGEDVCPACGAPSPRTGMEGRMSPSEPTPPEPEKKVPGIPEIGPEPEEGEADETNAMPRIESAIPAEDDLRAGVYHREHLPRTRVAVISALAAIAVVGGASVIITHPWNPEEFSIKATTAKDTSQAGYPGALTTLAGQDSDGHGSATDADEATYEILVSAYERMGALALALDESTADLEKRDSMSDDDKSKKQDTAYANQLEASNILQDLAKADVSTGTYEQTLTTLKTIGSYLRNRADSVKDAWDYAIDGSGSVSSAITDAGSYESLFDSQYAAAKPQAPGGTS